MAWWDGMFGKGTPNYYASAGNGLAASSIKGDYGGAGTYGYVKDAGGNYTGMSQDAYNAAKSAGVDNLYTGDQMKDIASKTGAEGGFGNIMGMGAGVLSAGGSVLNALTGMQALGLAKKQFEYEKALGNANLYNSATQVNNAYNQQAAVGNALAGSSITDAQKQASLDAATAKHLKTTI